MPPRPSSPGSFTSRRLARLRSAFSARACETNVFTASTDFAAAASGAAPEEARLSASTWEVSSRPSLMRREPGCAVAEEPPELLGDKRDERMQQKQGLAEHEILDGQAVVPGRLSLQLRFGDLDVPVAEIVPEKPVQAPGQPR